MQLSRGSQPLEPAYDLQTADHSSDSGRNNGSTSGGGHATGGKVAAEEEGIPTQSRTGYRKVRGKLFKYDVSVALNDVPQVLSRLVRRLQAAGVRVRCSGWGISSLSSTELEAYSDCDSAAVEAIGGKCSSNTEQLGPYSPRGACELELCVFGHVGDQNIHVNVLGSIAVGPSSSSRNCRAGQSASGSLTGEWGSMSGPEGEMHFYLPEGDRGAHGQDSGTHWRAALVCEDSLPIYIKHISALLDHHLFQLVVEKNGKIVRFHTY